MRNHGLLVFTLGILLLLTLAPDPVRQADAQAAPRIALLLRPDPSLRLPDSLEISIRTQSGDWIATRTFAAVKKIELSDLPVTQGSYLITAQGPGCSGLVFVDITDSPELQTFSLPLEHPGERPLAAAKMAAPPAPHPAPAVSPKAAAAATGSAPADDDQDWQRIFFATNRSPNTKSKGFEDLYGFGRSDALHFGTCIVSFPHDHRMGRIERPHWYKLSFSVNPAKHVAIRDASTLENSVFFSQLDDELSRDPDRRLLIFVHGFNVKFGEAVLTASQMAFDLQYKGVTLLFTWPSRGGLTDYPADEATSEISARYFESLLDSLSDHTSAAHFQIVAHSMGARIVTRALANLREQGRIPGNIDVKELVLAAPDMDVDVLTQLRQDLLGSVEHVTLYGSSHDKAIKASHKIHKAPRAGEGGSAIVVLPGVETIDASDIATGLIDHSYVGDNRSVVTDLDGVLHDRRPSERCCLKPAEKAGMEYWIFRP